MVTKTISFGKIDYRSIGKRVNEVDVVLELSNNNDGFPVFSAFLEIWNGSHTNTLNSGALNLFDKTQIYAKIPYNKQLFQEIMGLAKKYNRNNNNFGTKKQQNALIKAGLPYYSEKSVAYLKRIGLYSVELTPTEKKYNPKFANVSNFIYGTTFWFYHPIPTNTLVKIKQIMAGNYRIPNKK